MVLHKMEYVPLLLVHLLLYDKDLKMQAVPFVPTAECIVQYLAEQLSILFARELSGIILVSLQLFETPNSYASWSSEHD